jgi:hypothetical protein
MVFPLLVAAGAFIAEHVGAIALTGGAIVGAGAFGSSAGAAVGNNINTLLIIAVVAIFALLILRKKGVF